MPSSTSAKNHRFRYGMTTPMFWVLPGREAHGARRRDVADRRPRPLRHAGASRPTRSRCRRVRDWRSTSTPRRVVATSAIPLTDEPAFLRSLPRLHFSILRTSAKVGAVPGVTMGNNFASFRGRNRSATFARCGKAGHPIAYVGAVPYGIHHMTRRGESHGHVTATTTPGTAGGAERGRDRARRLFRAEAAATVVATP